MDNPNDPKKPANAGEPTSAKAHEEIKPVDYLRAVKAHLRNGRQKEAFRILQQGAVQFPEEPLILSYYGCLQAVVDKKYRSGVETCRKAIALLKKAETVGEEILYPVFYLNLGRAYVAAGKKKDALDAFNKGLRYDNSNRDLLHELRALGMRKKPPVPFLDRSNPINKYIGMILHMKEKEPATRKSRGRGLPH
jgi:tetratricopeptide (TPR) repeat protein